MMNYSSSRILTSMHPSIRHLNIRNVAKIVASKIICNTQLQLQYNPDFCRQLGVSAYSCINIPSIPVPTIPVIPIHAIPHSKQKCGI